MRQLARRQFSAAGELESRYCRQHLAQRQHWKPRWKPSFPFFVHPNGILVPWTCFWVVCIFLSPVIKRMCEFLFSEQQLVPGMGPPAFSSMTQLSEKTLCLAAILSPRAVPGLPPAGLPRAGHAYPIITTARLRVNLKRRRDCKNHSNQDDIVDACPV